MRAGKDFILYCVFTLQEISVVEQEKLDNMMIEMDGTENKCESNTRQYIALRFNTMPGESVSVMPNLESMRKVRNLCS